jgi:hypothetical protein
MRYSEWWFGKLAKEFNKHFDEVYILGDDSEVYYKGESVAFSPVDQSIKFESSQIKHYMNIELRDDDILFLADISFPGIFPNVLYHKRPKNCFAFCHGTAKNKYDYYSKDKKSKFGIETNQSKIFDAIFVGSKYHKDKLGWDNTIITTIPPPPDYIIKPSTYIKKTRDIISVARPCVQKVNKTIEKKVAKRFSSIERKEVNDWKEYSNFLSSAKALLITTKEDTFNYTIMDAIKCSCVPIAPNNLCFPEILPRDYLYNNENELYTIIKKVLDGNMDVPELLCQEQVNGFYTNICYIMKEDRPYIGLTNCDFNEAMKGI